MLLSKFFSCPLKARNSGWAQSADFFKSWLPKEWFLMLHVFAILTSLNKWDRMEILPDQADLLQGTYLQLILHVFIRIICFKNWFYVSLEYKQICLNRVPHVYMCTIWLPDLPPILGQEGIIYYLQQGQLIITTSVKISLTSHILHRSVRHPKGISCPAHSADLPGIFSPAEAGPPSPESKYWHPKEEQLEPGMNTWRMVGQMYQIPQVNWQAIKGNA